MPAVFFLPLPDLSGPVRPEHLHAVVTSWLDVPAVGWSHRSNTKPYTISPVTVVSGQVGVEISVLNDAAERLLRLGASASDEVRLGCRATRIGELMLLYRTPWEELTARVANSWRIEFLTPTTFRNGDRCTPMPTAPMALRAPSESWQAFAPNLIGRLDHAAVAEVWVSEVDLQTEYIELRLPSKAGRPQSRQIPAVLGSVTYRCDDSEIAAKVGPLFQLAPFCGIGSFRGKGLGVVRLGSAV